MNAEHAIASHYAHGSLEQAILDALAAAGKDVNRLVPTATRLWACTSSWGRMRGRRSPTWPPTSIVASSHRSR